MCFVSAWNARLIVMEGLCVITKENGMVMKIEPNITQDVGYVSSAAEAKADT